MNSLSFIEVLTMHYFVYNKKKAAGETLFHLRPRREYEKTWFQVIQSFQPIISLLNVISEKWKPREPNRHKLK